MNGCNWYIEEVSQKQIREELTARYEKGLEAEPENGVYFGITYHDLNCIILDKDLPEDRKKKTLYHELTHCYIGSYITQSDKIYNEEDICDIVANSHDMIDKIVKEYFKEK